jgi:hypothetical protein
MGNLQEITPAFDKIALDLEDHGLISFYPIEFVISEVNLHNT